MAPASARPLDGGALPGNDAAGDSPAPPALFDAPSACPDAASCDAAAGGPPSPDVAVEVDLPPACAAGLHLCAGVCVAADDATRCGPACLACSAPVGATPACRNDRCEFVCLSGRRCNDRCIAAEQPCDGQCLPGFTNCRDTCVPSTVIGPELCDGKDNDCNGSIDDGVVAKPCTPACAGMQTCVAGAWSATSCARTETDGKC
jgi:hypothetical protein